MKGSWLSAVYSVIALFALSFVLSISGTSMASAAVTCAPYYTSCTNGCSPSGGVCPSSCCDKVGQNCTKDSNSYGAYYGTYNSACECSNGGWSGYGCHHGSNGYGSYESSYTPTGGCSGGTWNGASCQTSAGNNGYYTPSGYCSFSSCATSCSPGYESCYAYPCYNTGQQYRYCSTDSDGCSYVSSYGSCDAAACCTSTCSYSGQISSQSCGITNGSGSQSRTCSSGGDGCVYWGNWETCYVTGCNSGYHLSGNSCISNTTACPSGWTGNATWSGTWNSGSWNYSACQKSCDDETILGGTRAPNNTVINCTSSTCSGVLCTYDATCDDGYHPTGNGTNTAACTPNTFTFTFDGNNHTSGSMPAQTCTYDQSCVLTDNTYARTGYQFTGWSDAAASRTIIWTDAQTVANYTDTTGDTTNNGKNYDLYATWNNCLPGYYWNETTCTACPQGTYKDSASESAGATQQCTICPDGTTTSGTANVSVSACNVLCSAQITGGTAVDVWATPSWEDLVGSNDIDTRCPIIDCDQGWKKVGNTCVACDTSNGGAFYDKNTCDLSQCDQDGFYIDRGNPPSADDICQICPQNEWYSGPNGTIECVTYCTAGYWHESDQNDYLTEIDINDQNAGHCSMPDSCSFQACYNWFDKGSAHCNPQTCIVDQCKTGYHLEGTGTDTKCIPNTYTITLHKSGSTGTVVDSIECTFDSENCVLPANAVLAKQGHTNQTEWCKDISYKTDAGFDGDTGDRVATATECYDAGVSETSNISQDGTDITLYAYFTENQYVLTHTPGNGMNVGDITGTLTTYLRYNVGFSLTDGSGYMSNLSTTVPTRRGYTLMGYRTADNCGGDLIVAPDGQFMADKTTFTAENAALYACWEANVYKYTLEPNGGNTPVADVYVKYDTGWSHSPTGPFTDRITVVAPTRTFYKFTGYYANWNLPGQTLVIPADGNISGVLDYTDQDVTLLAGWSYRDYSIQFDSNGGDNGTPMADISCTYSQPCTLPSNTFKKDGYLFGGWASTNAAANAGTVAHADHETFDFFDGMDVTYYAIWYYNARFAANGGSGSATPLTQVCYHNNYCYMADQGTLAKTAYAFDGWSTSNDGTGVTVAAWDAVPSSTFDAYLSSSGYVDLYARWKHTLTFDGNGQTTALETVPAEMDCYFNGPCVLPTDGTMTKTGYTFDGWNRAFNGSGANYTGGTTYNHAADTLAANTLYARWKYNLVFDGNQAKTGSVPSSAILYYNQDHTIPGNVGSLTRGGRLFDGWDRLPSPLNTSTSYATGMTVNNLPEHPSATVSGDTVTLFAKWYGCDPGYWNDGNDMTCHPTGPGYHSDDCDEDGSACTSKTMCPSGTYAGGNANAECNEADPGHYTDDCLDTTNWLGCTTQTACPAGTYSSGTGATRTCTPVPPGGYTDGDSGADDYNVCAEGSYNIGTGNYDDTMTGGTQIGCIPCPAGTTTNGGSSQNPALHTGIASCNQTCEIYGVGVLEDIASYNETWWDVETNTVYSMNGANTKDLVCTVKTCGAGSYRESNISCTPCAAGSFTAVENYASSCTLCAKGSYNDQVHSTGCTACMANPADWAGTFGSTTSAPGATSCDSDCSNVIPSLKLQPGGIVDSTLVNDWTGTVWTNDGSTAAISRNTVTNDCVIVDCRAGAYYKNGECWLCNTGSYNVSTGSLGCVACQSVPGTAGSTTSGPGMTGCDASCNKDYVENWLDTLWRDLGLLNDVPTVCGVNQCVAGHYYSGGANGQGDCDGLCAAGYYCPPGSTDDHGTTENPNCDTNMDDCPPYTGEHKCKPGWISGVGAWYCEQCPAGSVSSPNVIPGGLTVVPNIETIPGYADVSGIITQTPGTLPIPSVSNSQCWYCGPGLIPTSNRGACQKCPVGTYKASGDESAEVCTLCPPNSSCLEQGLTDPVCLPGYVLGQALDGKYTCEPLEVPCTIGEFGYGTQDRQGNCVLTGCLGDNHISADGTRCDSNVIPCETDAGRGWREWDPITQSYGTCTETECKTGYQKLGTVCIACDRENAVSYKAGAGCIIDRCERDYHVNPTGTSCDLNTMSCTVPHGISAVRYWANGQYGICTVLECEFGYHISSNACVADTQGCYVEHGTGVQEWIGDGVTGGWSDCMAATCNAGYTNDPSQSNEPSKPCGACRNKFGLLGEIAVSSYAGECEIAACMYQGEVYNLENNECVPLCDVTGYDDETGHVAWNPNTHKCVRTCNVGYTMW